MIEKDSIHISGVGLPKKLFDAARNNKLIIFSGAGVSLNSGIPDFNSLTNKILEGQKNQYTGSYSPSERLERAEKLDGLKIKQITKEIIEGSVQKNKNLACQELLIKFFGDNPLKIVTTNFDTNLSKAAKKLKLKQERREEFFQPALPLGNNFNGIVYLHGSISDEKNLVLTEEDFAKSYLEHGRTSSFLREIFAKYVILFIGYSFNDKLLQFLVKSGEYNHEDGKRFILINDEEYNQDPQKWKVLGINAIPYNKAEGNHDKLWELIKLWGEIKNRAHSKHQREIKKILRKSEPSKEDFSYLKTYLENNEHLARYFCNNAKSEFWIDWVYKNKFFDKAFEVNINNLFKLDLIFIDWFASLSVQKNYKLSFDIIAKELKNNKQLNSCFINSAALALHRLNKLPQKKYLAKWIGIIFSNKNNISKNYISYILQKCNVKRYREEVLILINKLSAPDELYQRNNVDSSKFWLKDIWKQKRELYLESIALELEPIISFNLGLHELKKKSESGLSVVTYTTRAAIEEHQYNQKFYFIDVLIDIARDLIDHLIQIKPLIAKEIIESWHRKNINILKRLAIYGITKSNLSAKEKFDWLIDKPEILAPELKHEKFILIKEIYQSLEQKQRRELIRITKKESKKNSYKDYQLYNLLEWLKESDPNCNITNLNLEKIKQHNPDFTKTDHPDLSSYMGGARWGHLSPVSKDELKKLDISKVIELLRDYKNKESFQGPDRNGLIREFGGSLRESDFDWSFKIAKALINNLITQDDAWEAILDHWRDQASETDGRSGIIKLLLDNEFLLKFHYQISQLLSKSANNITCNKSALKLANKIQNQIFKDKTLGRVIASSEIDSVFEGDQLQSSSFYKKNPPDWYEEAINSSGYYLCEFFIKVFDRNHKNSDKAIEYLNQFFLPFLQNNSYSAKMARVRISHILNYFFEIDKGWTEDNILPLFNWDIDADESLRSWQSYLYNGQWNKNLYPKLLELNKITFVHFKGLGQARESYCQHIAGLSLFSIIFKNENPLDSGWLYSFLQNCEEIDLRFFAYGILEFLSKNIDVQKNIKKIWDDFLLTFLSNRMFCKPKPINQSEFLVILDWGLYLNDEFSKFIDIIIDIDKQNNILTPENPPQHLSIIRKIKESDLSSKEIPVGKLLHHLLSKKCIMFWDKDFLKEILNKISSKISKALKGRIREESIKCGFKNIL